MFIKGVVIVLCCLIILGCASSSVRLWVTVPGKDTQVVEVKGSANLYDSLTDKTIVQIGDVRVEHQMKLGGVGGVETAFSAIAKVFGSLVGVVVKVIF